MTTHLIVQENISQNQLDVILRMFRSWNIDARVERTDKPAADIPKLPLSAGLWADYDIDDRTLRAKAWGTEQL
jgi:hypothetical protein